MKRRVIFLLFLLLPALVLGGKLTLDLNKQTITPGEEILITLTAHGKDIAFSIPKSIAGYPVASSKLAQGFSATFGNGTASTQYQKSIRLTLSPEHNITIPPLRATIDGATHTTQPVSIHVTSAVPASASQGGYTLTMLSARDSVYVGEAFLVQVIFEEPRNSNIVQAKYDPPTFDGFFVKSSPQERLVDTPEGTQHVFDYILTPQREGNLTLTAPKIKLGIQTFSGSRDPWGFFSNEVHWRSLNSASKTIHVRPLPIAADIVGAFELKSTADPRHAKANTPINYTLAIEGKGSLEEMDDPSFKLSDVTVYSDDAKIATRIENGRIVSRWTKKYTFIADHDFTIPAQHFNAFDPATSQSKRLTAQPIAITIQGAKNQASVPTQPKTSPLPARATQQHATKPDSNDSLFEDTAYYAKQTQDALQHRWPWWSLLLSFLGGALVMLLAMRIGAKLTARTQKRTKKYTPAEALEILYPHTNDSPQIETMVRQLYRIQNGEKDVTINKEDLQRLVTSVLGEQRGA